VAAPFLAAGLIDSVHAYLPDGPASRPAAVPAPWPLVPPGFISTAVTRLSGLVRVDAQLAGEGSQHSPWP
jgi:hypothetical protein